MLYLKRNYRDKRDCTPLHHAAWAGAYECVKCILQHDRSIIDTGGYGLIDCEANDPVVDWLNDVGDSALHLAAHTVCLRVVGALLHVNSSYYPLV